MNKSQYKREMECIVPRSGFEEDTITILEQAVNPQHKEEKNMINKSLKFIIAAVAAAFLLTSTAFAAVIFLRPDEVAESFGETAIADAFRSEDAIVINQSQQSNGYTFTLMGIVSGAGLEGIRTDSEDRSYVVLSIEHTDGTPFVPEDSCPVTITPLIDGFEPWRWNIFSLDAYRLDITIDGTRYCLVSTDSIEIFADHRVSIAVFDGFAPSPDTFIMNEDGVITYKDSYTGTKAMFCLPLDPAKADPAAVASLVADWYEECSSANSITSSDNDSVLSGEATGATIANSVQQVDDEIIITNEYGDRFTLVYEEDGSFRVYGREGNELPAAGFEALINEKSNELNIDLHKNDP